jgi:hypothetical protein
MTEADIIHALNGLPIAAIARTLARMDAHDISIVDIAESGLPKGMPLGPVLVAGEAHIVIIFGAPQGLMRSSKRWRIVVSHRDVRVVDVLQIERVAK